MPKALPSNPRRALLIKLGHIGDVLVTTPVVTALKERWPDLAVDLVVNPGTEAMVAHNPQINQVLTLKRNHAGPWPRRPGIWAFSAACAGLTTTFLWNWPRATGEPFSPGPRGPACGWVSGPRRPGCAAGPSTFWPPLGR